MFVQMRKMIVKEGFAEQVVERFSTPGLVDQQEGFVDATVMVKKVPRGEEEVIVMFRWESEEAWKNWEKSDAHIAGHKANMGKPKPEFIISTEVSRYEIKAVRRAATDSVTATEGA